MQAKQYIIPAALGLEIMDIMIDHECNHGDAVMALYLKRKHTPGAFLGSCEIEDINDETITIAITRNMGGRFGYVTESKTFTR